MRAYKVGETCTLTEENFQTIQAANRSIKCYPSDRYLQSISRYVGQDATILNVFSDSYEFTIKFADGQLFYAKSNFVTYKPVDAI